MSSSAPMAKLADIADLNPPLAASLSDGVDVSFMPMAAVDADSLTAVDRETRRYSDVRKGYTPFLDGDVLVAKITPCFENGKIAQVRLSRRYGFGSTEFHVVRPRSDRADARYLAHFLRQDRIRKQGESRMTGSAGQRRVPEHFLAGLTIPFPPLHEQRRIAEILDKADALRAKRRAALAQLDTLTQSIFLDMFGDPATNPKGWPINGLSMFGEISTGKTPPTGNVGMFDGEVPFATPRDLDANLESTQRTLTAAGSAFTRIVRAGSALVGCIGNIGKMAKTPVATAFNQQINAVEWGSDVDDDYGIAALGFSVPQMLTLASSTTVPILNKSGFSKVRIAVPPLAMQRDFAARISSVGQLKLMHRAALEFANELFSALQHRAFRGEL